MISKREYANLKPGDHVWASCIIFSQTGNLICGTFAELELEKTEDGYHIFKTVKVEKGSLFKKDKLVALRYHSHGYSYFSTREEALEDWNKVVYNTIDWITSNYEQIIKRVKEKLIES